MPITQVTPQEAVQQALEKHVERLQKVIIRNLAYVGEEVVNAARENGNYKDQTGNLRSSVGYVLVKDGEIVRKSDFPTIKAGEQGSREGLAFALELADQLPEGVVLIVVAGMRYAKYVSDRTYDVVDSAELLAERLVPRMLRELSQ